MKAEIRSSKWINYIGCPARFFGGEYIGNGARQVGDFGAVAWWAECGTAKAMGRESLKLLAPIAQKYPDSPLIAEALYEQGWAKQNLGKPDEALKDYEDAATRSRDKAGARARFMIGEIYFEKKNYDEAIKQFQRVMFGLGGDKATPEVRIWQAQAGFETGRCWEVQIQGADAKKKQECVASANS